MGRMDRTVTAARGLLVGLAAVLMLASPANRPLAAGALEGEKTVYLVSNGGEELAVGTVRFAPRGGGAGYALKIDDGKFSDQFLSMRPFKCLEGGEQTVCYLPYPHPLRRQVSADDLTDLEYDLLFLHKAAGEYGINFWNGIYYKLSLTPDGAIKGVLKETDMNELASPPAEHYGRLIGPDSLTDADLATHRFPTIIIR